MEEALKNDLELARREDESGREIKGSLENIELSINDLPVEMLLRVFSYLSPTQKLIARLVCPNWNEQISFILQMMSYFVVSSKKSLQVILDSELEWTKIMLSYTGFILPKGTRDSVSTLRIEVSRLGELMALVVEFPHVTSLELNVVENKSEPEDSATANQDLDLKVRFKKIVAKLRTLSVTFKLSYYTPSVTEIIKELDSETMVLTEFKIEGVEGCDPHVEQDDFIVLLSEIYRIIFKTSRTLLSLDLGNFYDETIVNSRLYPEFISKLTNLKELKLASAFIHTGWEWINGIGDENSESHFLIYKKFFQTQMVANSVMKNVSLPWSPNPASCEEFIRSLPQCIEFVKGVHKDHNISEYFSSFTKLKCMTLNSSEMPTFSHQCPSLRRLIISSVEEMEVKLQPANAVTFYTSLGAVFTNLVELHIESSTFFYDWSLQLVIQHLNKLRSLYIGRARYIHDFGVTGIDEKYSDELLETRKLHLHRPVPKEKIIGLPLSSLKMLEKLVIIDANITDFGIYYGLQFGSTLKHLTISSRGKISDWGLHWLGAGNPCLESFDGSFMSSEMISTEGADILREQLPLIKSTQKFKIVEM